MERENKEKQRLENELVYIQSKMDEYLMDNEDEDAKYIHLQEQYQAATGQKEKLTGQIKESSTRYNDLNEAYEEKMDQHKIEIDELQQKLTSEYEMKIENYEAEINELQQTLNKRSEDVEHKSSNTQLL